MLTWRDVPHESDSSTSSSVKYLALSFLRVHLRLGWDLWEFSVRKRGFYLIFFQVDI